MSPDEAYEPSSQTGVVYFLVDLAWMLFLLFVVALIVAGIVGIVRGGGNVLLSGDTVAVKAQLIRSELKLPNGMFLTENPDVSVQVRDATSKQVLLTTAITLAKSLLVALVLWFLRGLARSAKEGDPFAAENVRRLRGLGYTLAFGGPIVAVFESWANNRLFYSLPADSIGHLTTPEFSFPLELILAGMGAFILAAVFAYGVHLREDVEATV
jgi:Protein of unknown function (DUF2975)